MGVCFLRRAIVSTSIAEERLRENSAFAIKKRETSESSMLDRRVLHDPHDELQCSLAFWAWSRIGPRPSWVVESVHGTCQGVATPAVSRFRGLSAMLRAGTTLLVVEELVGHHVMCPPSLVGSSDVDPATNVDPCFTRGNHRSQGGAVAARQAIQAPYLPQFVQNTLAESFSQPHVLHFTTLRNQRTNECMCVPPSTVAMGWWQLRESKTPGLILSAFRFPRACSASG